MANLNTAVICHIILTLENIGTLVNYYGVFYKIGPWISIFVEHFYLSKYDMNEDKAVKYFYPSQLQTR